MKPSRGFTPARRPPPPTPSRRPLNTDSSTSSTNSDNSNEEVAVYCRIRPLENDNDECCIKVLSDKIVQLSPPESSRAFLAWGSNEKEMQYTFKKVFDMSANQKYVFDQVGLPLVKDLLNDKNGLLFTYGVTGSGKTHTMQGHAQDGGLLSRAIDVIFNSMEEKQVTRKHLIVPDKTNSFQVQEVADAMLAEHQEMVKNRQPRNRGYGQIGNNLSDPNLSGRLPDDTKIDGIDQSKVYAVFISYVEIYNNYIYDLLETDAKDLVTGKPKFTTRMLREDMFGNMYIANSTEVHVMSPREALETFYRGQKRRRVAQTQLNHESSRSHSVFSIRIVKAHPGQGEEIDVSKSCTVTQLSLVDLAGSERTSRTGNTGNRLREAGNINNSLMTLRACIEKLRENQKTGKTGNVPYRNSKITHLFRNYFEGQGSVRMIVCVNPRASDFDETINVLQFAELTQQVQIERRPDANIARDFGLTPGQKRANEIYKDALKRVQEEMPIAPAPLAPIYSLGPPFPSFDLMDCDDDETLENLERFLEKRIATRTTLIEDHKEQHESFRSLLVDREQEIVLLREENSRLKNVNEADRKRIRDLEDRLVSAESSNNSLQRRVQASHQAKTVLENELDEKELLLSQQKKDQHKTAKKLKAQITQKELVQNELEAKLKQQQYEQERLKMDKEKLRAVEAILQNKEARRLNKTRSDPDLSYDGGYSDENYRKSSSDENYRKSSSGENYRKSSSDENNRRSMTTTKSTPDMTKDTPRGRRSVAVANPRYRRSQSTGAEKWVDHHAPQEVSMNTILKPAIKSRKKSVTRLSERDLIGDKATKYCLTTHEQDTDGEVEMKLFKGDVIPTSSGGRQVVFNDVEILRHKSPDKIPVSSRRSRSPKKRSYEEDQKPSGGVGSRVAAFEQKMSAAKTKRYH